MVRTLTVIILILITCIRIQAVTDEEISEKQDRILKMLDTVKSQKGVAITGRGKFDLALIHGVGNALQTNSRTREYNSLQQIDLRLEGRPFPYLMAGGIIRLQNKMSGFYGTGDFISAREVYLNASIIESIKFRIGDFRSSMTPFTLWAPIKELKYESKLFTSMREDDKYENFFDEKNKWPLQGINIDFGFSTDFYIKRIRLDTILARLSTVTTSPYDRFLGGARVVFQKDSDNALGLNTIAIFDAVDTGTSSTTKPLLGMVYSSDIKASIRDGLTIVGEIAHSSLQTNSKLKNTSSFDEQALRIGVDIELFKNIFSAELYNVGEQFFSPGAQTRTYNTNQTQFLKGQHFGYSFFDRSYTVKINTTRQMDVPMDYTTPLNDATPNRSGFVFGINSKSIGIIEYGIHLKLLNETTSIGCREYRKFLASDAGIKLNLNDILKYLPIITGVFSYEKVDRKDDISTQTLDDSENIKTILWGAGLEFDVYKNFFILGAYEKFNTKGSKVIDVYNEQNPLLYMSSHRKEFDKNESMLGIGIIYEINRVSYLRCDFRRINYKNNKLSGSDYKMNVVDMYYLLTF